MLALFRQHPGEFFARFERHRPAPGILGWCVAAPCWIPLVYFLARGPLRGSGRAPAPVRAPARGAGSDTRF